MKSALLDASSFVEISRFVETSQDWSQDKSQDRSVTVIAHVDSAAPTWGGGLN